MLALALLAIGGRGSAQEPLPAVWQERELAFTYSSSVAIYTCDALQNRVAAILYAVGARPDLQVKVINCSRVVVPQEIPTVDRGRQTWEAGSATRYVRPVDREQVVTVRVMLSVPVEMTPEVIEDLKKDKSRRELVSRVTGNPLPKFDDPVPFAAERQIVTLSKKTIGLEPFDCELLDQLATSSFRTLGVRVVRQGYSCDRRKLSLIPPTLDVEALVAASAEPRESSEPPETGGDDAGPSEPPASDEAPAEPPAETKPPAESAP